MKSLPLNPINKPYIYFLVMGWKKTSKDPRSEFIEGNIPIDK